MERVDGVEAISLFQQAYRTARLSFGKWPDPASTCAMGRQASMIPADTSAMSHFSVQPVNHPIDATVELPGSKSLTNRALLIAALAQGTSTIRRALFSDDTHAMHGALSALGIAVDADQHAQTYVVRGEGGRIPASAATLFVGNAGTAAR